MGGAAASETLIGGGYNCTIGGCSAPLKQPRENAGCRYVYDVDETAFYGTLCYNIIVHKIMEAILICTTCVNVYALNWHALIGHWKCERSMSSHDSGHFCGIRKAFTQNYS